MGCPAPARSRAPRPGVTHGDNPELPGHRRVPGKPLGKPRFYCWCWFCCSIERISTQLSPQLDATPMQGDTGTSCSPPLPHRDGPRDSGEPRAVSTHRCGAGHQDGDSAQAGEGHRSAPSPSGFSLGDPEAPRCPLRCHGGRCPSIWGTPERHLPVCPPPRRAPQAHLPPPRYCLGLVHPPNRALRKAPPSASGQPPFHGGCCSLPPQGTQFCLPLGLPLSIWGGTWSPPHCHGGCSPPARQGASGRLPWR